MRVIYLPDAPDGSKVGVNDYLVTGGTVEDLYRKARPFDPGDYAKVRLSRNQELSATIKALQEALKTHEWKAKGKPRYTRRKVMRALTDEAEQRGNLVPGGLHVTLSERQQAELTGVSRKAVSNALAGLEDEEGLIRRDSWEKFDAQHARSAYFQDNPLLVA